MPSSSGLGQSSQHSARSLTTNMDFRQPMHHQWMFGGQAHLPDAGRSHPALATQSELAESGYPFHSAYPNRLCDWFGRLDHPVIGCGSRAHGLLHQTEEELAAAFRPPAIEAKREFIQVVRQMPR